MLKYPMLVVAAMLLVRAWLPSDDQGGTGAGRGRANPGLNAIVGHVVDASGKPVPDVFVTAARPQPTGGRAFTPVSVLVHSRTNSQGEFHLEGLSAGDYDLIALPHNSPLDANRQVNRVGHANTWYPNAISQSDAKVVHLNPGVPASADITLAPAHLSVVSGVVIGAADQPVHGGSLELVHGDGFFGFDARRGTIRTDGTFIAPGLQPGTYFFVFHEGAGPPARGVVPQVSQARADVAGADISALRVAPLEMVRVTGRIVFAERSGDRPEAWKIRVSAFPYPSDGNPGPQRPGVARDDFTFEFATWPLPGRIRVAVDSPVWTVRQVRLNGMDVTDKNIDFIQGKLISGLEIELAKR